MNKAELIDAVSGQTGQAKTDTAQTLDALLDAIGSALAKGEKVQLVGFGTFEPQHRAARTVRNPQTGAAIEIAARKVPVFTAAKILKDAAADGYGRTCRSGFAYGQAGCQAWQPARACRKDFRFLMARPGAGPPGPRPGRCSACGEWADGGSFRGGHCPWAPSPF